MGNHFNSASARDIPDADRAASMVRGHLSLREGCTLARVEEARVRKDIERGVLTPRTSSTGRGCLRWIDVLAMWAAYGDPLFGAEIRRAVFGGLERLFADDRPNLVSGEAIDLSSIRTAIEIATTATVRLGPVLRLSFSAASEDLAPRLLIYARGLMRIEESEHILGGAAVFRGSRLSVRHVGLMLANGELAADILADYPYLDLNDLDFAKLYSSAHSPLGRPRKRAETRDGAEASPR